MNHTMIPQANHDELARQNFVKSFRNYLFGKMRNDLKLVYQETVKPQFEKENQRSPKDRYEIRREMQQQPSYKWYSSCKRITQEMMWESVITTVERQLPNLVECAKDREKPLGTLTLNPELKIPTYQTAVDIHCMPGGYNSEYTQDDVAAGAIYDLGVYVAMRNPKSLRDVRGQTVIHKFLKQQYPNFQPGKILDMGCTVGANTLPYVDAYPNAEVYGIDLAPAILRYSHARAESLGKRVHFSQQNAEKTNFPDESFDLVVSHILLHEIPVPAIRNVFRESYRLLAPGGIMIHQDARLFRHLDLYTAFIYDEETTNNNEPFWSAMRDLDLVAVAREAGFSRDSLINTLLEQSNGMQSFIIVGSK
ncbi:MULTISPECIES: class I SAM-dependent methyltransferase [Okeania]|uniref:Class I SAM-dependent methyltransferase n=2 Tax=Okeania TaxID=1458928 RepID=A0A3N6RMF7_9CYAN|nr:MULTISPECIES: class I SAM-dependent methyltransferase [Okeania]NET21403.1 class I SAM-dependent methyltransferase [Okeania sp. SIO1H5]NES77088.1 class I SAM-dependent methyltransferase [Okeania sp. SIO1H4]NET77231.1 class I SAM-dependent methyltransferase [Okeania sp. SIO1F9]NET93933.1 class I SAM-dependent methyltransferase [Okeania sp. SIO1H2]RQH39010.1 class I SAM-dependent methyltransferase [Okeania hirsuta]